MDFGGFSGAAHVEMDREKFTMLEAEGQRYASFFSTLEQQTPGAISRGAAITFFAKSSLSDKQVEDLYATIKAVGVTPDFQTMGQTEFVMGMHMIVCLTKRELERLPVSFPTYLFPTLALPTPTPQASGSSGHADLISSMPSPDKPVDRVGGSVTLGRSCFSTGAGLASTDASVAVATPGEISKLQDTASLTELVQREVQNAQLVGSKLSQLDQSEVSTLQHLQATLKALAAAVQQLGFPIPSATYTSIGALDDLGNFLRANVQSVRQEIQSLEIAERMRSVADEATSRTNSANNTTGRVGTEPSAAIAEVSRLTHQLASLQQEVAQLQAKKATLVRQVLDKKVLQEPLAVTVAAPPPPPPPPPPKRASDAFPEGSSLPPLSSSSVSSLGSSSAPVWGNMDFGGSPQDASRSIESTQPSPSFAAFDAPVPATYFGEFGAFGAAATAASTAQQPQDDSFGWGAFQ